MFFVDDALVLEQVFEPRLRAVLTATSDSAGARIRPTDLLVSAFHSDAAARDVLAQSVRGGMPPPRADDLSHLSGRGSGSQRRTRSEFSPGALHAVVETATFLQEAPRHVHAFALDFLLHLACAAAEDPLPWLDAPRAAVLFRARVEQAFQSRRAPKDAGRSLPPELAQYQDLTHLAQSCRTLSESPFDGDPQYERLFDNLARALHRRQGRHVLLVGERGVAKTTVVAEFARRAATGVFPGLARRRLILIDVRYVAPDESRAHLAGILKSLAEAPEIVACVDGFAALLRGERPAANQATLFQILSRARGQLVALLTPREYESCIADDPDFAEFFARVDVEEPGPESATKVLRHYAQGLAEKFRVRIKDEAVRQAVELTAGYVLNDHLPAKALKVLARICEDLDYARIRGEDADQAMPAETAPGEACVTAAAVVREVSRLSGVPEETLRGVAEQTDYARALGEVIFGQEHAIREVSNELGLIKAGMTDPGKPASVMLFLGQTGTGKTELAKALARFYSQSRRLRTYALGNCVEPHSVSTIIGVPPGYVGNDQGGRIVHELNADPYCVFLLDEADKAHPDVLQPFLNLFDEGWVSDQRGVRAYADKSIFILTSNVGQRMLAQLTKEGKGIDEITTRMREALSQIRHTKSDRPVFTPEFLARIKRIIVFKPLTQEAMEGISRKLTAELCRSWQAKRGRRLEVPETLIAYLAAESHRRNEKSNGKEGGRIVRKLLSDWAESPLQREVSRRRQEYRECTEITLAFEPPAGEAASKDAPAAPPEVRVCFNRESRSTLKCSPDMPPEKAT